jgi:DNA-binding MarR family transcriptional regulator
MRHAYSRDANLLGALVRAGGHGASGPAALVALDGLLAGASIDALARVCGLSHSGAVRLVDRLAETALVERRLGADGRAVALWLTPAGRRAARRIRAQREAALEGALAPLGAAERAGLAHAAELVLAGMAADAPRGDRICRLCDTDACGRLRGDCPVARAARRAAGAVAEAEGLNADPEA